MARAYPSISPAYLIPSQVNVRLRQNSSPFIASERPFSRNANVQRSRRVRYQEAEMSASIANVEKAVISKTLICTSLTGSSINKQLEEVSTFIRT